jgi:hypothetical protein
MDQCLVEG